MSTRIDSLNDTAAQIGLTATPRQIRIPQVTEKETLIQVENDERFLADNLRYFDEPAFECTYLQGAADGYLAPNEIETYDLFQDGRREPRLCVSGALNGACRSHFSITRIQLDQ